MLDLSQEVYALLQELRPRLLAPPPDLGVYVASVSSDLEPWRTCLIDQLTGWNCRVLSASEPVTQLSANLIQKAFKGVRFQCISSDPSEASSPRTRRFPSICCS